MVTYETSSPMIVLMKINRQLFDQKNSKTVTFFPNTLGMKAKASLHADGGVIDSSNKMMITLLFVKFVYKMLGTYSSPSVKKACFLLMIYISMIHPSSIQA